MTPEVYQALGAAPDTYQQIMNNERRHAFALPGRYEELFETYTTGLFSPGRPGILHHELDQVYEAEVQEVVSGRNWVPIWQDETDSAYNPVE